MLFSRLRAIWSTGMSRGKCGTICLERRCLRFALSPNVLSSQNTVDLNHLLVLFLSWFLCVQVEFLDTSIIITEPYFNFSSIQESMNEILFEEYQFQSALRINGEKCRARTVSRSSFCCLTHSSHTEMCSLLKIIFNHIV